jgi:hypothetical protein
MATTDTSKTILPEFLVDWKPRHRSLSDEHRVAAGKYIKAIVASQAKAKAIDPAYVASSDRELWRKFRETYDDLGTYGARSENEDFIKTMRQL